MDAKTLFELMQSVWGQMPESGHNELYAMIEAMHPEWVKYNPTNHAPRRFLSMYAPEA